MRLDFLISFLLERFYMLDLIIQWHIRKNADLFLDLFLDEETRKLLYESLRNRYEKRN